MLYNCQQLKNCQNKRIVHLELTHQGQNFPCGHERRGSLHEEADGKEAVAQPGFVRHEDGEEDDGQDHVVSDHQRSRL